MGWLPAYDRWLEDPEAGTPWLDAMNFVLKEIGQRLMKPLASKLLELNVTSVTLVPSGLLTLLPLHAAIIGPDLPFGERFETRYVASATLLARCHARLPAKQTPSPYLVAVVNPDHTLGFADAQLERVARFFPKDRRLIASGKMAQRNWLHEHSDQADFLEFATYSSFDPQKPESSFILLAGSEQENMQSNNNRLLLGEIFSGMLRLKSGSTVFLNSCESGMTDQGRTRGAAWLSDRIPLAGSDVRRCHTLVGQ